MQDKCVGFEDIKIVQDEVITLRKLRHAIDASTVDKSKVCVSKRCYNKKRIFSKKGEEKEFLLQVRRPGPNVKKIVN